MSQQVAYVLYVARSTVSLYSVHGRSGRVRIDTHFTAAWDDDSLAEVLEGLLQITSAKRVSVVLDDSVVYRSEFSVNITEGNQDLNETVYEELRTRIPEEFSDKDVFLYGVRTHKKLVTGHAYVPVIYVYETLLQQAKISGKVLGSFLSEHEAELLDVDPIVESALRDETCITYGRKGIRWPILIARVMVALLVVSFVAGIAVGVYVWQTGKMPEVSFWIQNTTELEQPVLPSPTPEPTPPLPTPQPTVAPQEYRVLIQNGTGVTGRAEEVALEFQEERVRLVDTANAESFTYEVTAVQLKPRPEMEAMLSWVEETIGLDDLREISVLPIDAEYDLIVIVGQDAL